MGFWDWLPWNDDKPKAEPKPAPKPTSKPSSSGPQNAAEYRRESGRSQPFGGKDYSAARPQSVGTGYLSSSSKPKTQGQGSFRNGVYHPPALLPKTPTQSNRPALSPQLSEALSRYGWTVPTTEAADPGLELLETELDAANTRKLAEFSYGLDEGEAARIIDAYGSQNPGKSFKTENVRIRSKATEAVPLTQAAYDKLTPEQRKAVDFNTLLVDAREKDLMLGPKGNSPVPDELKSYNERAEKVFGKGGGSEAYAPNTLKLLEDIDFRAVGQDLDEFLSLQHTVTSDQLKGWTGQGGAVQRKDLNSYQDANEFGTIRSAENQSKVTADAIAKAGALIEKTLAETRLGGGNVNDFLAARAGQEAPIGWNPEGVLRADPAAQEQEEIYKGAFGMLSDPKVTDLNQFWSGMESLGYNEQQIDEVFRYIDLRTRDQLKTGKTPPGSRSPQEIRALAGLEAL